MAITTNREYIQASLNKFGLTETDVDLIIAEHQELESPLNVQACKKAMYNSFSSILVGDVSEGGYSLSWDVERLKLWYNSLSRELGLPSVIKAQATDRSYLW